MPRNDIFIAVRFMSIIPPTKKKKKISVDVRHLTSLRPYPFFAAGAGGATLVVVRQREVVLHGLRLRLLPLAGRHHAVQLVYGTQPTRAATNAATGNTSM